MPITIGNGHYTSEILISPPINARESFWKVLWEKIKDFFFSTGRTKADSYIHEMCFADHPPTKARLEEIFFGLKDLACALHKERFCVHNPDEDDSTTVMRITGEDGGEDLLTITYNMQTYEYKIMGQTYAFLKEQPDVLRTHPQVFFTVNKRYNETVNCLLPSTLCLIPADAPPLSVPLDNLGGYFYSECKKGNLDKWKEQERAYT